MKLVEQINNKSEIIQDFDKKLSNKEITDILSKYFDLVGNKNPYLCKLDKQSFLFCLKQVTYLGHPHPLFKKRIQIPESWKKYLNSGAFLVGLYSYKSNNIFVFFDTEKYKKNKLNNSSAHVHTLDLQKGVEYGLFEKKDSRGNKITVVKEDNLIKYIKNILNNKENETPKEIKLFDNFSSSLIKKWDGKVCYQEMFNLNYRNKSQPEWPGFYLEFKFEKYLEDNMNLKDICTFVSNKKNGQLDFDLNFSDKYLGDLKAHSVDSYYIPGNDKNNFLEAIRIYNKFWYVVFYHKTYMDKNYNNTVAKFWNEIQGKKDLLSYSNRMKNSIELTGIKILEINKYNVKYISDMTQGKNSNGKTRAIKIQIHKNFVDNFLIFNKDL